jgi:putative ABC transport system permease protein
VLRPGDAVRLGVLGLRGRPARTVLSALGIALGIAGMVAVLGISATGQAGLLRQIDALGTNLLTITPGQTLFGGEARLPSTAPAMIGRIEGVERVAWTGTVDARAYRSAAVDRSETNGLRTAVASPGLLDTLGGRVASGRWLDATTSGRPAVVLGATAARRLGVLRAQGQLVDVGGSYWAVVGVLDPVVLAPAVDTAVLVGESAGRSLLGYDGSPTTVYERSTDARVAAVRALAPAAANPRAPHEVSVSRPSDALVAKAAAERAFTGLVLGVGAVALLVGGIGVADVMVVSVLERRGEVGLRRALGATRAHVRRQFLIEALLLTTLGAVGGVLLGAAVTAVSAAWRGLPPVLPAAVVAGALAAGVVVGTLAGLFPAARAARVPPTVALTGP